MHNGLMDTTTTATTTAATSKVKLRFLDWAYAARAMLIASGFTCSAVEFAAYGAGGEFWTNADDASCLAAMQAVAS